MRSPVLSADSALDGNDFRLDRKEAAAVGLSTVMVATGEGVCEREEGTGYTCFGL